MNDLQFKELVQGTIRALREGTAPVTTEEVELSLRALRGCPSMLKEREGLQLINELCLAALESNQSSQLILQWFNATSRCVR